MNNSIVPIGNAYFKPSRTLTLKRVPHEQLYCAHWERLFQAIENAHFKKSFS